MKTKMGKTTWARLMFVLLLLLPLVAFFWLPGPHAGASLAWFWVALLLCWLLAFAVLSAL